MFEENK